MQQKNAPNNSGAFDILKYYFYKLINNFGFTGVLFL